MSTNSAANTACNNQFQTGLIGQEGALIRRLFILLGLVCFSFAHAVADSESCSSANFHENVTVKEVIDGDTVILSDDRHIRLIGINTPEIGRDNKPSEMGAEQAQVYLSRLVKANKDLKLRYDDQRTDHYGRTLAHLFLHDGTNIQSLLLEQGLATPLTIPPNLEYLECYQTSTEQAQKHKIGLWALNQYQIRPAESININDLGYRIFSGEVTRIGESKSSTWINIATNLALRITRDDLQYFDENLVMSLTGKTIVARGWIYFMNGEFRMRIRHPADLHIIGTNNSN